MGAFNDILATTGPNMGGLSDHLYIVPIADIDVTALAALDDPTDEKTVAQAIPLLTDKKWFKWYFTKGLDAKLSYPLVGERDGRSRDVMVDMKQPRMIAANERVYDIVMNVPVAIAVKDAEGSMRLCGINRREDGTLAVDFPMYMETDDANTGGNATEKKGHTIQFKGECPHTPLFHTAALDVTGAA
ncbi:hypothetical protein [Roseivirga thermotolerans]|uniref:Uncharacterized protein n=1 Tax=Roseivirga thermotolerans TaxID=1758176 RepID=A0ABQ3I4Y2_9BACT|nr:hypothetical protein [Roseivirga thermotolerans]GHE64914.1 hypothetical protein GCM10011340_19900 [Roseivirga thermotolerans]